MPALIQDRATMRRPGEQMEPPVGANARIFAGALVAINATGFAVAGATGATLKGAGVAERRADNTGGVDGAIRVRLSKTPHAFANSAAADAITLADIGSDCYMVDDQTVAKTNGSNTRGRAGRVYDVDEDGVWVDFR
jgi:hypothetical protein